MWHVVLSGVFKCHMSERKREWLDTEQILCLLLAHLRPRTDDGGAVSCPRSRDVARGLVWCVQVSHE
jgi:hypothetical protein